MTEMKNFFDSFGNFCVKIKEIMIFNHETLGFSERLLRLLIKRSFNFSYHTLCYKRVLIIHFERIKKLLKLKKVESVELVSSS